MLLCLLLELNAWVVFFPQLVKVLCTGWDFFMVCSACTIAARFCRAAVAAKVVWVVAEKT